MVVVFPFWSNVTVLLPEETGTMPGAFAADSLYSVGLMTPRACPATWSASATMPANSGVASLVPQAGYQPAGVPACGKLWYVTTGAVQEPLIETPGTPRAPPTTFATPFW